MSLSTPIKESLTNATAKALATSGQHGINVVPVSMIKVNDDSIWLFDFFMNKTAENIKTTEEVSLTAWTDMTGIQVKATVQYLTDGELFEEAVSWVKTKNTDRVTKGLLILKPTEIFDICPGGAFSKEDLTF